MNRIQQIKKTHPWLDYEDLVKVLIYHHQGSSWIHNLQRDKLQQSMDNFSKLVISKKRKALQPFVEHVLGEYYNGVDKCGNQIEESSREESFEHRWNRARAILLNRK